VQVFQDLGWGGEMADSGCIPRFTMGSQDDGTASFSDGLSAIDELRGIITLRNPQFRPEPIPPQR
jgi:hypothetical protein